MRKPGRPLGPIAIAVLDLLRQRAMTAREVAHELKLSVDDAKKSCSRLMQYGLIEALGLRRIASSDKPVRVYRACRGQAHPAAMMSANRAGARE